MSGSGVRAAFTRMVAVVVLASIPSSIAAQPDLTPGAIRTEAQDCEFLFEFAAMRDLLGDQVVGNCLEDQRFVAANDNAEQRTTNGNLVISALDSYMRFVTDTHTWIRTPNGLFDRPNDRRFDWEGDRQLIDQLRQGGYVIYFRHGPTESSQRDADSYDVADCQTQRNLTDQGRNQAAMIGVHLRTLQIPVGEVISSPFCRAHEYAYLLFGYVSKLDATLIGPDVPLPPDVQRANIEAFQQQLQTAVPTSGQNLVFVAHSPIMRAAMGVELTVEGSAAILAPVAGAMPTTVARILPGEWASFALAMASE
jgi:phosphohistidine phosphatase SixA